MATESDRTNSIHLLSTDELWKYTHAVLGCQEWGKARRLLDELGLRNDNVDMLLNAQQYGLSQGHMIYRVIQDRIDLVNAKVR